MTNNMQNYTEKSLSYDVASGSEITPFILYLAVKSMHIKNK